MQPTHGHGVGSAALEAEMVAYCRAPFETFFRLFGVSPVLRRHATREEILRVGPEPSPRTPAGGGTEASVPVMAGQRPVAEIAIFGVREMGDFQPGGKNFADILRLAEMLARGLGRELECGENLGAVLDLIEECGDAVVRSVGGGCEVIIPASGCAAGRGSELEEAIQNALPEGIGGDFEVEVGTPVGPRFFRIVGGGREGGLVLARDITRARKAGLEAEELGSTLACEREFRRALMAVLPVPVFVKDLEGRYIGCNAAFSALTGVLEKDLAGRTVEDLWPEMLAARYRSADEELFVSGGSQIYEGQVKAGDGSLHAGIFSKCVFRDDAGAIAGLVGCFVDLTTLEAWGTRKDGKPVEP